jgi:hypothetical protein
MVRGRGGRKIESGSSRKTISEFSRERMAELAGIKGRLVMEKKDAVGALRHIIRPQVSEKGKALLSAELFSGHWLKISLSPSV